MSAAAGAPARDRPAPMGDAAEAPAKAALRALFPPFGEPARGSPRIGPFDLMAGHLAVFSRYARAPAAATPLAALAAEYEAGGDVTEVLYALLEDPHMFVRHAAFAGVISPAARQRSGAGLSRLGAWLLSSPPPSELLTKELVGVYIAEGVDPADVGAPLEALIEVSRDLGWFPLLVEWLRIAGLVRWPGVAVKVSLAKGEESVYEAPPEVYRLAKGV